jgi:hypothetical protein
MSSEVFRVGSIGNSVVAAMRRSWSAHRSLTALTLGSAALLVAAVVLGLVDDRQVLGTPVWMKPAKFAASVGVAAPVLTWIIGQMRQGAHANRIRAAGSVVAAMGALELSIITIQAARGVPSHFNASSPLDGALFTIMGLGITVFWLAQLYLAIRAFRLPFATGARTWAIRLGLAISLLGGGIGFAMPRPTPAQLASQQAGRPTPIVGAHAVGVPDGGPGLPISRWSTEGGDLRVPHFFGLHALQGLPLVALWLERRRRPWASSVIALGVGWTGLTLTTLVQALRAQPLVAPDAFTLALAGLSLLAAAAIAIGALRGYLALNASDGGSSSWLRGNPVQ